MLSKQEQIDKTNEAIADLVYEKKELLKAYNYYAGKRDAEQYRYLEENFGIGNATSVEFTPLIKKHIDALLGEYLSFPILPKISCKDESTITNIGREKQLKFKEAIVKHLNLDLHKQVIKLITGKDDADPNIKELLDKMLRDLDLSFISQYEIAGLNVIQYILQSRQTDMVTKLRQLIFDLLASGYNYYQVKESPSKTNIQFEVLDPRDTFADRNPDSIYIKDSYRVVVRKWLTRSLILNKYGKELTREEIKSIKEEWKDHGEYHKYGHSYQSEMHVINAKELMDDDYRDINAYRFELIPVYEVEWIEVDDDFIMQRYSSIRIGEDIFITKGIDENVVRTLDNPSYCCLSVNGVVFLNRSNKPYSLITACIPLQDKYDLLCYYRDTIIANSGVKGLIVDFSMIPASLGVLWPERILKWLAYRKAGTLIIDSALEGRSDNGNAPNQIYNGYDDTLPVLAIQAILLAIQLVEDTTSSITGVFRERLNGIEQRDAVSNVKQGVNNSFMVTKHYYQLMDLVVEEMLTDGLNQAKRTWKNGLTGTLILGELQLKIFTALPEHFTITDFDVHILSSTQVMEDMLKIQQILPDFVKSGAVTPDIIFECLSTKSLPDLKYKVKKALLVQKEENNLIQQLSQKLEETSKLAQDLQKQLEQALKKIELLNADNLKLEQHKILLEYQVNTYKAQTDRQHWKDWYEVELRKVAIEEGQLHDGNPYNDEVNFGK